jgi:hypothetical protein
MIVHPNRISNDYWCFFMLQKLAAVNYNRCSSGDISVRHDEYILPNCYVHERDYSVTGCCNRKLLKLF